MVGFACFAADAQSKNHIFRQWETWSGRSGQLSQQMCANQLCKFEALRTNVELRKRAAQSVVLVNKDTTRFVSTFRDVEHETPRCCYAVSLLSHLGLIRLDGYLDVQVK